MIAWYAQHIWLTGPIVMSAWIFGKAAYLTVRS